MNNAELSQAIEICNRYVFECTKESPRYEPLMNHLKALLAEQLRRATQNAGINISSTPSMIEQCQAAAGY